MRWEAFCLGQFDYAWNQKLNSKQEARLPPRRAAPALCLRDAQRRGFAPRYPLRRGEGAGELTAVAAPAAV